MWLRCGSSYSSCLAPLPQQRLAQPLQLHLRIVSWSAAAASAAVHMLYTGTMLLHVLLVLFFRFFPSCCCCYAVVLTQHALVELQAPLQIFADQRHVVHAMEGELACKPAQQISLSSSYTDA